MFQEKRLVSKIVDIVNPIGGPQKRWEEESKETDKFMREKTAAAAEELQRPIVGIVDTTRKAVVETLLLPVKIAKKAAGLTTDLATGIVAAPANIARWAIDMLKLPASAYVTGVAFVSEQIPGRISKIAKNINTKVHSALGTTPAFQKG